MLAALRAPRVLALIMSALSGLSAPCKSSDAIAMLDVAITRPVAVIRATSRDQAHVSTNVGVMTLKEVQAKLAVER